MTGKKLIKLIDKGGYALYKTRMWGERSHNSDRNKGIRKIISKKSRRYLKSSLNKILIKDHEQ